MIGFIGLGQLGSRLAALLVDSGHDVMVYDLSDSAIQTMTDRGATGANSCIEVGRQCHTVLTCLPSPQTSEAVMLGENGLLSALSPGSVSYTHLTLPTTRRV